jgi:hypothetical protein
MWRKCFYWTLALFLFFGLLVWWFWPRDRLTPENLAKVQVGMSLDKVMDLLGEPITLDGFQHGIISAPSPNGRFTRIDRIQPYSAYYPRIDITNVELLDGSRFHVWVEQKRGFFAGFDERGIITKTASFPVETSGGGAWNWLKSQYQSWTSPSPRTVAPPPAVLTPTNPNTP